MLLIASQLQDFCRRKKMQN
ncbi:hypothetical protein Golob_001789 [Gossypium lobatum]|uniref:Uncharacterized protein n=1 Tax=Gossypium lobatum TaxID=34289 RepID=A0A7J8NCE4_9ROSI|nr:hypothetical protein [Gossypium lobatum]